MAAEDPTEDPTHARKINAMLISDVRGRMRREILPGLDLFHRTGKVLSIATGSA
jgi:hypothetical protein